MKKQILKRAALGFPLGIALGYIITIIISLVFANGFYSPAVPALIETAGSEIGAVVFQAVLSGLLGAGFAASSVIWEVESWSIAKQTSIYFLVISCIMLPIAYFANWMEHSLKGFSIYIGIFVAIFIVMWIIQYSIWKKKINKINSKIQTK